MPNIGGPRSSKRLLFARVVSSVLLYGAPIWAKALEIGANKRLMDRVYRLSAIRVCSAFRTASGEATWVIAGMLPIDIIADEGKRIYDAKKGNLLSGPGIKRKERDRSMQIWQDRWSTSQKGRWTYKLIPKIELWINRNHCEVNYHLKQFVTGHGGYRSYLHKYGHDDSPFCPA